MTASLSIYTRQLSFEEGLEEPDDWKEAWVWSWKGRRTNIEDDIISGKGTNMAGHMSLVLPQQERIFGMGPIMDQSWSEKSGPELSNAVLSKDRAWLEQWSAPAAVQEDDASAWWALEAGIPIIKAKILYSPQRLREVVMDRSNKYVSSCRYAWNIDVSKRHLNCNTFFQAWRVTKNLPFIKKLSEMHNYLEENLEVAPLSSRDYELAYSVFQRAEASMCKEVQSLPAPDTYIMTTPSAA